MPAPRAFTATTHAVRDIADRALAQPEGVTLTWLSKTHGLAECARASRAFQISFCSLRNRADRQRLNHYADEPTFGLDIQSRGIYGKLACVRSAMPEGSGWSVRLCAADDVFSGVVITDTATGEEITGESSTDRRLRIIIMALQDPVACKNIARSEWDWMCSERPDLRDAFEPWCNSPKFRADFYADTPTPTPTFVGQDALLAELGDDPFAEVEDNT